MTAEPPAINQTAPLQARGWRVRPASEPVSAIGRSRRGRVRCSATTAFRPLHIYCVDAAPTLQSCEVGISTVISHPRSEIPMLPAPEVSVDWHERTECLSARKIAALSFTGSERGGRAERRLRAACGPDRRGSSPGAVGKRSVNLLSARHTQRTAWTVAYTGNRYASLKRKFNCNIASRQTGRIDSHCFCSIRFDLR
jgi:hypothetical protein